MSVRPVTLLEELDIEGVILHNARGLLCRRAATRIRSLEDFVFDLMKHGLRFDLNPTHDLSDPERFWHGYIRRVEQVIRERAQKALEADNKKLFTGGLQ